MESIVENQVRLIKNIPLGFKRYMYYKINWSNRMIGLVGLRGVGETTLVLQYKREYNNWREPQSNSQLSAIHGTCRNDSTTDFRT